MHQTLVLNDVERYRRWSTEQKRVICLEAFADGACVRAVARKYELLSAQLYAWRRLLIRKGDPPGDYGVVGAFVEVRSDHSDAVSTQEPAGVDLALASLNDLFSDTSRSRNRSGRSEWRSLGRERVAGDGATDMAGIEVCLRNGRLLRCRLSDDLDLRKLAALADLLERT